MAGGGLFLDYRPWLVVAAGVFLLSVLFWIPLVRGITRSLSQMTETTAHIAEGRFDVRTTIRRSDELGRLSAAINQMTGRLSDLVNGQRRFLGDIAHELCSPLARIQMALGVLEQRLADPQKSLLTDLSEEVEEMSVLVNELLAFTQASLGSKQVRLQRINLLELVQKAAQREAGARAAVLVDIPERLEVQADANLLGRAVANLIRNALRYAGNSSPPGIQAYPEKHEVILRIYDEGPGVPAIELNRLFEPFYRPDQARSRETGGIGLGLAIVKSCVEACHGSVTAMNRKPAGFEVRIRLKAWKP
jgi:two-component system sensor histidine kinase CpxA